MYYGEIDGTGFVVIDERFRSCFVGHARVERVFTGTRWAEGPAWFAAHRYLVWSDIPNDRIMRWDECSGRTSVFRAPSNNANGNTVDSQGRLVTCEHLTRRVTRTEVDGTITALATHHGKARLNAPNDVVVKSDGSIWFTDPGYGICHDYEGDYAPPEYDGCYVFRIDPETAKVTVVADDFERPNGLAFSPDEQFLYVADTGVTHRSDGPRHIRRLKLSSDGQSYGESNIFAECTAGLFDGFRVDQCGRIWTSAEDGVHVYESDGVLIGKVLIPEMVSNLTFGGQKRNRIFICGTTSLYSVFVTANGL